MTAMSTGGMQEIKAAQTDLISICVCTFRRPELLQRLLQSLVEQSTEAEFDFEIVITDNDSNHSAHEVVRKFAEQSPDRVVYDCELEPNIAMARNRCVRNSNGNFIAFIDDDEYASKDWLLQLYRTLKKFRADGVQGPVLPDFPARAPTWLKKSGLCDRRRSLTGTITTLSDARTGNVLFRRDLFQDGELWFDPAFGRTGGEDGDFFRRQGNRGRKFYWCDEALAHETVPEGRWTLSFYTRKAFRIGTIYAGLIRRGELPREWLFSKSVAFIGGLLVAMPLLLLTGKQRWGRAIVKISYSAGYILGSCGISVATQKQSEVQGMVSA